jgi:uridine kinase
MPNPTYVIAISGPSGAGKSTAIHNLVNLLGDAVFLSIDDYPDDHYPPALGWIERGANPDEFETPQFFADVRALKEGKSIIHPDDKVEIYPPAYLIIEEPFGKSRTGFKDLIDFHAEIDTPLEIAFPRRLLRIMSWKPQEEQLSYIKQHIEWYLRAGRRFYLAVQENARKDKDITMDGTLPPETIAQQIFDAIILKHNH